MALPLQPDLRPWPVWQRRLATAGITVLAVVALGVAARPRTAPPRVLHDAMDPAASYLRQVERLVRGARERVWVMVYVIHLGEDPHGDPVRALGEALAAAAARGCDVRLVLDRDHVWGTDEIDDKHLEPARWLRAQGVPVVIDDLERRTHAKVVLVDDRHAVVGSHNWTRSALLRNREASLLLEDPAVVSELEELFRDVPGWTAAVAERPR